MQTDDSVPSKEMVDHFMLRTRAHLYLVRRWSDFICGTIENKLWAFNSGLSRPPFFNFDKAAFFELTKYIETERDVHDQTKFEDPEYLPYIFISWMYRERRYGREFDMPNGMTDKMNAATVHHIVSNKHHPEAWDPSFTIEKFNTQDRDKPNGFIVDASLMPDWAICSMMADWFAMATELGTDPRKWIADNVQVRWKFNPNQVAIMNTCLELVWDKYRGEFK